ncbi:hypothetical protein [Herbidospora sp. NBRC 101105]|uniref:nSTAND1 domain-containing NTPase n=1 Tax=Herbidospora sp. NBRC 101105 TaxID=3032195 RepID=UPI0025522634|nr:hypothetical protein [Herbidospora sp. NBRC 101105]
MRKGAGGALLRAVRSTGTAALRAAPHTLLLILCAGAFTPVAQALLEGQSLLGPGLGVVDSVGGNMLAAVLDRSIQSMRGRVNTPEQVEAELLARLEAAFADAGTRDALLSEAGDIVRRLDLAQAALETVKEQEAALHREVAQVYAAVARSGQQTHFLLQLALEELTQIQIGVESAALDLQAAKNHHLDITRDLIHLRRDTASMLALVRSGATPGDGNAPVLSGSPEQCPYPGLRPFDTTEAALFHGREALTTELLMTFSARLGSPVSVVVTGSSGAGKSSLIQAGLLSSVKDGLLATPGSADWPQVVLTPGDDPLGILAAGIAAIGYLDTRSVHERLLESPSSAHTCLRDALLARSVSGLPGTGKAVVVVDQFEEVFTRVPAPGRDLVIRSFVAALTSLGEAPAGLRADPLAAIVIGVRADYLSAFASYPHLQEAVSNGLFLVGPMSELEFRAAITGPALAHALEPEQGLADFVLDDIDVDGPIDAVLPLLSQAMAHTWERRQGNVLTIRGYVESGGIAKVVEHATEAMSAALTSEQRALMRPVFLRMVEDAGEQSFVRKPVAYSDLYARHPDAEHDVDALLDEAARARVVVMSESSVTLAHDVLLTSWSTLRAWLHEETSTARVIHRALVRDTRRWEESGRSKDFLYRGAALRALQVVRAQWQTDEPAAQRLTAEEEAFVRRSVRAERNFARTKATVAATLAVSALTASFLAVRADLAAREADLQLSRHLAESSVVIGDHDPAVSQLLAATAWHYDQGKEAHRALRAALARAGRAVLSINAEKALSTVFSPDGRTLVVGATEGKLEIWDVATRRPLFRGLAGHTVPVESVAFDAKARRLATAGGDGVRIREPRTGKVIDSFDEARQVNAVVFAPDGRTLAVAEQNGLIRIWDVAAHRFVRELAGHRGAVTSLAFDHGTGLLASGGADQSVRLWDPNRSTSAVHVLRGHGDRVTSVAFSSDGAFLASGGDDGTIRLWNPAAGVRVGAPLRGHTGYVRAVAFAREGHLLASTGQDDTVRLWDADGRRQAAQPLLGHSEPVNAVAFGPGGTFATAASDGRVRLWQVPMVTTFGSDLSGASHAAYSVAIRPQGDVVAFGLENGGVSLYDVRRRRITHELPAGSGGVPHDMDFSPDGKHLAVGHESGEVRTWTTGPDGTMTTTLVGRTGPVNSLAYSGDGRKLAAGGWSYTALVWDLAGRPQPRQPYARHKHFVRSVALNGDGSALATGGTDAVAAVWDTATGRRRHVLNTETGVEAVAFSPDGRRLATGNIDGVIRLWDTSSGEQVAWMRASAKSVLALVFLGDTTFATGDVGGSVRIWDTVSGRQLGATLTAPHSGKVGFLDFALGNGLLVAVTVSGAVRMWKIAQPRENVLHDEVCRGAARNLTVDEWDRLVPGRPHETVCERYRRP